MVGILLSFGDGPFSGAMLVFRDCYIISSGPDFLFRLFPNSQKSPKKTSRISGDFGFCKIPPRLVLCQNKTPKKLQGRRFGWIKSVAYVTSLKVKASTVDCRFPVNGRSVCFRMNCQDASCHRPNNKHLMSENAFTPEI